MVVNPGRMRSTNKLKPLSEKERTRLLRAAILVAPKAYAPYSKFRVGAAVLGEKGIYFGVNVENASYGLTLCAERSALSVAIAAGDKNIRAIAIASIDASTRDMRMPCGACRQWMIELAPKAEILITGCDKPLTVEELIPHP